MQIHVQLLCHPLLTNSIFEELFFIKLLININTVLFLKLTFVLLLRWPDKYTSHSAILKTLNDIVKDD
jgi:hypothetical protein